MNRKKAIYRILLIGGGVAGAAGGIKLYQLYKSPALEKLAGFQPLIDELAETIIPATDSPGAKEAGTGLFISLMLKDCTDRKTQNNFLQGLDHLVFYCQSRYGKPFDKCTAEERIEVLRYFEKKGKIGNAFLTKAKTWLAGDSFFTTLKKYTVLGYCSSREGATKALRYDHVPAQYKACIPLEKGQAAWATN